MDDARPQRKKKRKRRREGEATGSHGSWPRRMALGAALLALLLWATLARGAEQRLLRPVGMADEVTADDEESEPSQPTLTLTCLGFEASGKVQHVSMRKYTQQAARRLGVAGYIQNTERGTVEGEVCAAPAALASFRQWLEEEGSPKSRVDAVEYSNERGVSVNPFNGVFAIRKVTFSNGKQWA